MTERFYVTAGGEWIGAVEGPPPPGSSEVPSAPDRATQIWDFDTETWSAAIPPAVEKVPTAIASAKLTISDGTVEGFAADSAIAGGFAIDTGKFWMFFGEEQPDTNYIVNVFDGGLYRCYVQPEDYSTDSFVVTTTDLAGAPADPACISIIIMRAL